MGTIILRKFTGLMVVAGFLMSLIAPEAQAAKLWGKDYFPNVSLTTHEGEEVDFYTDVIQGKVVAINFMFTSCENVCPAETARLREVQKLLADRVGEDIHMYSISIDPEIDTPEELAKYRKRFDLGPGWTFLTAPRETTDLIQKKLGLLIDQLEDPNDHNASLILGNEATGKWIKRSPYDNPKRLAHLLAESLSNWHHAPRADRGLASYSAAPSFNNWGPGESLFRSRCVACHSIGEGKGLGPDLADISDRRERAWLVRWIMEPDLMVAEGDATALELMKTWDDLRMPNFGLSAKAAAEVLDFIAEYQLRVETSPTSPTSHGEHGNHDHDHDDHQSHAREANH
jgi:protein SCO1